MGLDLAVKLADLLAHLGARELAVALLLAAVGLQLVDELLDPHRAEDPLLEESQHEPQDPVLAHRDPERRSGRPSSLGGPSGVAVLAG